MRPVPQTTPCYTLSGRSAKTWERLGRRIRTGPDQGGRNPEFQRHLCLAAYRMRGTGCGEPVPPPPKTAGGSDGRPAKCRARPRRGFRRGTPYRSGLHHRQAGAGHPRGSGGGATVRAALGGGLRVPPGADPDASAVPHSPQPLGHHTLLPGGHCRVPLRRPDRGRPAVGGRVQKAHRPNRTEPAGTVSGHVHGGSRRLVQRPGTSLPAPDYRRAGASRLCHPAQHPAARPARGGHRPVPAAGPGAALQPEGGVPRCAQPPGRHDDGHHS